RAGRRRDGAAGRLGGGVGRRRVEGQPDDGPQDEEEAGVGGAGPEVRPLERGGLVAPGDDPEHEGPAGLDGDEAQDQDTGERAGGVGEIHVDSVYRYVDTVNTAGS